MERVPVSSSNLHSVGYDSASQILEIEFNTGSIYQYLNVPSSIYHGLMSASSHGQYFSQYIRNVFRYRQIR
ncbi:MAG: KTSC domain-containing protein [Bellilinea sp.]